MNLVFRPEGIYVPLVTPFTRDGKLDEDGLKELISFLKPKRIHGLVPVGGTGEYVSLSISERKRVIKIVREASGRIPVIPGVLSPGVKDAVDLSKYACEVGADAILLVAPYYNRPTQEGICRYYEQIASTVDIPIVIYNIPYKTGVNVEPETVMKLSQLDSIVAIKECCRELRQFSKLVRLVGNKISVLCGEDDLFLSEMMLGAKGGVLASSNLTPEICLEMYEACKRGDYAKAIKLHSRLSPLLDALFVDPNPVGLKEALKRCGRPTGDTRAPLLSMSEKNVSVLDEILRDVFRADE